MRRAANAWDRFYRHHAAPWRGERSVTPLRPWLGSGPVLELGCGNGKLLHPLRQAGVPVVGLDIAWNALVRLAHQDLVMADAAWLPFRGGAFTAVLDVHCGGHLGPGGRRRLAAETARVLRPGGHAVVERLGGGDLRAGQGRTVPGDAHARCLADGRSTWFPTLDALVGLYEEAGLATVHADVERRSQRTAQADLPREHVKAVLRRPRTGGSGGDGTWAQRARDADGRPVRAAAGGT